MTMYRIVETYLFDTCTLKCGYCWLAESGKVLDSSQLKPFRDPQYIDQVTGFFNRRTSAAEKWHLQLTGGEPQLMPNFSRFCSNLFEVGNRVSLYTALIIDRDHPSFRFLTSHAAPHFDYLMCSFHPEAEAHEEEYWRKVEILKDAGHNVIVRFVGHPKRLHLLERLSKKCKELNLCFYPTTLFSKNYPGAYSDDEKTLLAGYFSSLSQTIQLAGGIDTTNTKCYAGNRIIATYLSSGDIWPCISVQKPLLGNVYQDRLELMEGAIGCPKPGMACNCDVHFQQDIVIGTEDSERFAGVKAGYTEPMTVAEQNQLCEERELHFSAAPKGIGSVEDDQTLIYSKAFVKSQLLKTISAASLNSVSSNGSETVTAAATAIAPAPVVATDKAWKKLMAFIGR
jgi:organic radical activating enzyme